MHNNTSNLKYSKMLEKKKIDRKIKKYIRGCLGKGYTKPAVKKSLVSHGYSESYVEGLLRKHSELQFVKAYTLIVALLSITSILLFNIAQTNQGPEITGYAAAGNSTEQFCASICSPSPATDRHGAFPEFQQKHL